MKPKQYLGDLRDDEGKPLRSGLSDHEIAKLIPRPTEARCKLHHTPGCFTCKSLEGVLDERGRVAIPSNPEVARRSPGPSASPSVVIPVPPPEDHEKILSNARAYLDVPVDPVVSAEPRPIRYFYQPLPRGETPEWPEEVNGMSVQNIAMFLMMPEFIYSDYEKNKANPPKRVFVTPEEAVNRPHYKSSPDLRPDLRPDSEINFTVTHVGTEIAQRAEPILIHIPARPPKQKLRKVPPPPEKVEALRQAKVDHRLLKAKHIKTLDKDAQLSKKESATARKQSNRKIHKLQAEIDAYDKPRLVDIPNTGHAAMKIIIPPCPEGSEEIIETRYVRQYIRAAFHLESQDKLAEWNHCWAKIENKLIRRAYRLNLVRGWPNDHARAEWRMGEGPTPNDPGFKSMYGWYDSKDDADNEYLRDVDFRARQKYLCGYSAKENAANGYRRDEDGAVPDESIRRVGPGTAGGWHGGGAGPNSDEHDSWHDAPPETAAPASQSEMWENPTQHKQQDCPLPGRWDKKNPDL